MIVPVFKTGGWQALLSPVGSTPTRFRHVSMSQESLHAVKRQTSRFAVGHLYSVGDNISVFHIRAGFPMPQIWTIRANDRSNTFMPDEDRNPLSLPCRRCIRSWVILSPTKVMSFVMRLHCARLKCERMLRSSELNK